ncbi:MAG TPA: cytochrome c oxidase subunit I, partial [Actinomycetota bacterium]|nr:cytochrome c oxidase subunit I [Actinomycetota bacterium]
MAITLNRRATERLEQIWKEPPGLKTILESIDHKRLGLRYLYTAFAFFLAGGAEALAMRTQLARPSEQLLSPNMYNQLFTLHGVTMIFFFVIPMGTGFAVYLLPLMLGSRDLAFPRLNNFSYWVFLMAGLFMYSSWVINEVPNAGWFDYVPLASRTYSPGLNIDFYTLGLLFLGVSTTAAAINVVVTFFKMRAPGMTLGRTPLFAWAFLAQSLSIIFALPSLTAALIFLWLDRNLGFHFYDPGAGGDVVLWQHLFWIFGHPEVYIIFLPAAGVMHSIMSTFTRRSVVGYPVLVLAEMGTAALGFGVWVHHMFAIGLPNLTMSFFAAVSLVIVIPSAIQVLAWVATMLTGRLDLKTPMLFGIAFIWQFVVGGLSGAMFADIPFDQAATDSYMVVAHLHYVLLGASAFPLLAGLYVWMPKFYGRMYHEALGKLSFWLVFVGFNVTFFPMHFQGMAGMPRRIYTYLPGRGWAGYNLAETIGAYILTAGIVAIIANVIWTKKYGPPAPANPWGGETLEWATSSPPPVYDFAQIPIVRSRAPVREQEELR